MKKPRHLHAGARLSADTLPDIERRQIDLWRAMGPAGRLLAAGQASVAVQQLSFAGCRMRFPDATAREQLVRLAALKLGTHVARAVYGGQLDGALWSVERMNPLDIALLAAGAFEACGLRYVLGGSLASSLSGEPRSTLDIDMMVEMAETDVPCFLDRLGPEFHSDADSLLRAVRGRSSANVIHRPSAIKVDLFIMGGSPVDARQMERRRRARITDKPGGVLYVYAPEDILLQKLRWFRLGREVSDRQWRDILGIIVVQGAALDRGYLLESARELGVEDPLNRALAEAG